MVDLKAGLAIDLKAESGRICEFIQKTVDGSASPGVVLGMSGGVDSALVAALCVKALGPSRVFGVMLPLSFTPGKDTLDAIAQAKSLGIEYTQVPIDGITGCFFKELKTDLDDAKAKIAVGNVRSRTRMILLYYFANLRNSLVVGTGDKSEDLIGFFTKYGDGGVDFLPIAHLYKTQVRRMAEHLGVPHDVAYKPSSPQLHPGHKATDEIPLGYEEMDPVLVGLFDKKMKPDDVAKATGVPMDTINLILKKYKASGHKRKYPPMVVEW
jgi:NAD+ synthase